MLNGNALHLPLANATVQCVITSPPYWGLRDYGTAQWVGGDSSCDHKPSNTPATRGLKSSTLNGGKKTTAHQQEGYAVTCSRCGATRVDNQLGQEPKPDCLGWATGHPCGHCYVCHIVQVFREVWRVLRPDGVAWLNLGDSYIGGKGQSGQGNSEYQAARAASGESINQAHHQIAGRGKTRPSDNLTVLKSLNLKPKDLVGIPWRVALALQADGWYLRSDVIWQKPNCLPESVTDRPTKSHEHVFLLSKSKQYFYDHIAIQEPQTVGWNNSSFTDERDILTKPNLGLKPRANAAAQFARPTGNKHNGNSVPGQAYTQHREDREPRTETGWRNKRDVWSIPTQSYSGSHFATFPEDLVEPMLLAGTSPKACEHCRAPWKRIIQRSLTAHTGETESAYEKGTTAHRMSLLRQAAREQGGEYVNTPTTIGWQPTCQCAHNTGSARCLVLDPFAGTATVGRVAARHGRRFVGVELNPKYIELAKQRTANVQTSLISVL